ncbi:MAG: polyprenyl synthetase family protein, partial [Tumebacillaceae bacterium]
MTSTTATDATDLHVCPMSYRVETIRQELREQWSASLPAGLGIVERDLHESEACLRGLLVMLAGEVGQGVQEELLPASVAMELLYRAMSGQQKPGALYPSVLAGEVLYTRALSLVASMRTEAVQVFADLAEHLVAEKWKKREDVGLRLETTEQEYLEYAFARSAIVLANCCKMGALLGGCSSEVVEALTAYGYSLGMALQ